jgi:CBS domain-containing protein
MEAVLSLLMLLGFLTLLLLLPLSIVQGHGRSELEDAAQYEHFNPSVKSYLREVDGKKTTLVQGTGTSVAVAKNPEKAAPTQDLEKAVHDVMQKRPCYCFENQSLDEVRQIMRERDLPYLVVLDDNMRIVGMVTMRDLDRGKK